MTESNKELSSRAIHEAVRWVADLDSSSERDPDLNTVAPRFESWMNADPQNHPAFWRMQNLCDELRLLTDDARWNLGDLPPAPVNPDPQPWWSSRKAMPWGWAIAMSLSLLLLAGGAFFAWYPVRAGVQGRQASPPGQVMQMDLADGSHVSVNGEVSWDLSSAHRYVHLEHGEAQFIVSKKAVRFEVFAGPAQVIARGTTFSVKRTGLTASRTTVQEGQVEIRTPTQQPAIVHMGEVADFDGMLIHVRQDPDSQGRLPEAVPELLKFSRTPLPIAAEQFNRYNPGKTLVVEASLARRTISGQFSASDPDGFANAVALTLGLQHSVSHGPASGTKTEIISLRTSLADPAPRPRAVN